MRVLGPSENTEELYSLSSEKLHNSCASIQFCKNCPEPSQGLSMDSCLRDHLGSVWAETHRHGLPTWESGVLGQINKKKQRHGCDRVREHRVRGERALRGVDQQKLPSKGEFWAGEIWRNDERQDVWKWEGGVHRGGGGVLLKRWLHTCFLIFS